MPLSPSIATLLASGAFIPAHPLALTANRKLDEQTQRVLTRYYLASGVDGLAVGVHTTQFEIREKGMYRPVLELAIEEAINIKRSIIKIAGVSGNTYQAVHEAKLAADLGYDLALVSMNGLADWTEKTLIERVKAIAAVIPVFGFYLQPAVGGRVLSVDFWMQMAEIPNLHAIKIAPFNRYQTLDVVRAVCLSSREQEIALYTGNDDNILLDFLTPFRIQKGDKVIEKYIVGGLLGHWAVWTKTAVDIFRKVKQVQASRESITPDLLAQAIAITDANAAFFDAANAFQGCIAGLHEVLKRQGIMKGIWCLNPEEGLSLGQLDEINRVYNDYPELNDDDFVEEWLRDFRKL